MVILFANIKKRLPKLELLDSLIIEKIGLFNHSLERKGNKWRVCSRWFSFVIIYFID